MTKRQRAKAKTIGLLVGVFVLGGVTGAGVMRTVDNREMAQLMEQSPAEARRQFRLDAMARRLGLTPEQRQRIAEILRAERERCQPIDDQVLAQRKECHQRAQKEIREVLTPKQRQRAAQQRKKRKQRKQGQRPRRPKGPQER